MRSLRAVVLAAAAAAGLVVGGPIARRTIGVRLSARTERRLNRVGNPGPYLVSPEATDLHERLTIVDLHADSLLWGRELGSRADRGHVDIPRMVEGNAALQLFAASTKVPRHMSYDRNDDRSDDIALVALVQGWPRATRRSLTARAEYLAGRLVATAEASSGTFRVIRSVADLDALLGARTDRPDVVGGLLTVEGAHALDDDGANLDRLVAAGFRHVGLAHFFDNSFAGSAHGVVKGGLTGPGRELVAELERREIVIDLAHASNATIDDVLAVATRPVIDSHTGVRGVADHARNLSDEQLRGIAATGGIIGIGFWPTAAGGEDAASIARSIAHAVAVAGADHVGLGSDFDGAVPVPFDVSGLSLLTAALLAHGLDQAQIAAVMGGSAVRFLRETLPVA